MKTKHMTLKEATELFTQEEIAKAFGTTQPNITSHLKRGVKVIIGVEYKLKTWKTEKTKEAIDE